jgi:KipI family sensor histidine kinase inhibitor
MSTLPQGVRDYGDRALLVELEGTGQVVSVTRLLLDRRLPGVEEVVPGARTLLVVTAEHADLTAVRAAVAAAVAEAPAGGPAGTPAGAAGPVADQAEDTVEVPVRYDGPDLADVAALTGLDEDEVVAAHTGAPWRVAFGGFAPGFGYLAGGDPRLVVPRRHSARTAVPAGSVGLAGEFTGVYPRESPGGWQLIGTTALTMWDLDRDPPALLRPGVRVRFTREA